VGVLLKFSAGENHVPPKPAMCFASVDASCYGVFMSDVLQSLYRSICVFDAKKQQNGATESLHQY
jgi:hypothetical protein